MKKLLLLGALVALAFFAGHGRASAACTVPNTFTNNTVAQSALVNANFAAVLACINNVTGANIGPGGIYASNVIPGTVAQATFGGVQNYTFPSSLLLPTVGIGCVTIASGGLLGVTGANCTTSPISAANGGTATNGSGFIAGQCFYWTGTVFATQPCNQAGAVTSVTALAPLTVDNTNPTTPIVGLTVPLATQYGGLGVTGALFAAGTIDCIGGKFVSGTASVDWLPCLTTKSSWNGSAYVVTAQNTAPIVFTGVPISFGSCAAASGPTQAACASVNVPLPATPTAWGYASYSTWGCEAHLDATGTGGGVPMTYSAVISGSNIVVSVFNPYSFAIASSFNQTVGGVCQASATHV